MVKFSASELVKRSATQLLYKELRKLKWEPTKGQLKGDAYAKNVLEKEDSSDEKRGIIQIGDDLLFFCIDAVIGNKFVEIKMVDEDRVVEEWYFNSSVIQSTFYASLLCDVKTLDTPKFRRKEGYKQEVLIVPENREFELWFGKNKYKIDPNDDIKNHFLKKAQLISASIETIDYESCRSFDSKYKFKEFEIFLPSYYQIKQ